MCWTKMYHFSLFPPHKQQYLFEKSFVKTKYQKPEECLTLFSSLYSCALKLSWCWDIANNTLTQPKKEPHCLNTL